MLLSSKSIELAGLSLCWTFAWFVLIVKCLATVYGGIKQNNNKEKQGTQFCYGNLLNGFYSSRMNRHQKYKRNSLFPNTLALSVYIHIYVCM